MITVAEALDALFALVRPTGTEEVPLVEAAGRYMPGPAVASRTQPPFSASAMDGYALRDADLAPGARLTVIGEAAAGRRFAGPCGPGQAVRIFTGAPMPEGADRVLIQEDAQVEKGVLTVTGDYGTSFHVRPLGADFKAGDELSPRWLRPGDIALLAAMNLPRVHVARRPVVALLPTGDELVQPGEDPGPDQIVASNSYGLHALLTAAGAEPRLLPIARDDANSLETAFGLAEDADLLVTIGGASVGDHDLVGPVAERLGMERSFYKVAMRPGKPLMAGRLGRQAVVGLPGNPVSAMVCGAIFLRPMIHASLGLPAQPLPRGTARLAASLPANGPREHYMRASLGPDGLTPAGSQDSALLSVLAESGALIVRPPGDPPRKQGETVDYVTI
ncbi:molybdopterin molybdotransferase MoeA [Histidinibacterium aquaticum]|uniref:Molybdopterin molybdenumtransferase n=1 Tax=Histidinibacterium aquaticum TaxID=2613962 RepID=A0A5J5GNV6_9RHOB|nr:gephyrin-like molybdotransferase Glp [Histidinibacterium aquaticum]KAA9009122.1 molybdopterin molybdotransferase MoeA [Histidinibacterium aquaticum]